MDEMNEKELGEEQIPLPSSLETERISPDPEPDAPQSQKKKKKWPKVLLIIFLSLVGLILVLAIAVVCYAFYLRGLLNYQVGPEATLSQEEVDQLLSTDVDHQPYDPSVDGSLPNLDELEDQFTRPTDPTDPTIPDYPEPSVPLGDVVNIMLVGQDYYGKADRGRSDCMILMTFNKTTGAVTLTSFMRDAYVQIPGYKPHKLNHAYQYGGMALLNETLKVNFGVEVYGNITVSFTQFKQIIDMLGGVDIELTKAESDHLKNGYGIDVEPGLQRLDGKQALAYARIRHIDNDYVRAGRQRKVILSLIERYKSLPVTEMLALLEDILPMITTNIPKDDVFPMALELFPMLSSAQFATQQIPAAGTFKGGNVLVRPGLKNWFQYNIDFETNRRILRDIFDSEK